MARVVLGAMLSRHAGGSKSLEIEASNVRQLKRALKERFPALGPLLDSDELAVAIDGEIFQDPFLEPVGESSEVHFLPKIGGG